MSDDHQCTTLTDMVSIKELWAFQRRNPGQHVRCAPVRGLAHRLAERTVRMLKCRSIHSRCYIEFHRSAEVPANPPQTSGATRRKPYGAWAIQDVLSRIQAMTSGGSVVEDKQPGFNSTRSTGYWDRLLCPRPKGLVCRPSSCSSIPGRLPGSANNKIELLAVMP